MRSGTAGKNISRAEVINISSFGFWISIDDHEHFLPFETFPWFRDAKIADIINVKLLRPHHLHWPSLDIDLELDSIIYPDKYPLWYK